MASLFLFKERAMTAYSFKQDCKVYIVRGSSRWKIEVYPDLSFSQTVEEKTRSVKTLHDQSAMFEEATINKASPADFSFTALLVKGNDFTILGDWLTQVTNDRSDESLYTYDVYVDTGVHIFKITKGVLTRGTVQLAKDAIITVSLTGTASKLERFGPTGTVIPGTPVARDIYHEGIIPRRVSVSIDGVEMDNISSVTIELANDVQWVNYDTLHKSLYVTSASDTQYPEAFFVSKKTLSGTIVKYLTETYNDEKWSLNTPIRVQVGDSTTYYLDINIPAAVVTKQPTVGDIFAHLFNFRMTHSPSDVATVFNYKGV